MQFQGRVIYCKSVANTFLGSASGFQDLQPTAVPALTVVYKSQSRSRLHDSAPAPANRPREALSMQ